MGLLGLILFGLGLGAASAEVEVFERAAARDIRSRLQGEDSQVEVDVMLDGFRFGSVATADIKAKDFALDGLPLFTEPERSTAGRIGSLRLNLNNFVLRGLRVEQLSADIPGCRFDLALALKQRELRLSRSGVGDGSVKIHQDDLAEWITRKFAEIKSCKVDASRGSVLVEGYGEFLIVKTDFQVLAKLRAVDGTKLVLDDAKIWFNWQRADPIAAEQLLKTLNPVVDLSKDLGLYDAVLVEEIDARDGYVTARGKTKIPTKPAGDLSLRLRP